MERSIHPDEPARGPQRPQRARRRPPGRSRCSWWPAPGRARPGCSPTAWPISSPPATSRRGRSWPSPSPTRRPTRCASGSSAWSARWPSACGSPPSTPPACASCARTPTASATARSFTIYDDADSRRLVEQVLRDLNIDAKKLPARVRPGPHLGGPRPSSSSPGPTRPAPLTSTNAGSPTSTRSTSAPAGGVGHGLRRPARSSTVNLLQALPRRARAYQHRFSHVLVDEYQDTNRAQNELVAHARRASTATSAWSGDSDQSIYALPRRRHPQHPASSRRPSPTPTVIPLEQNYRSTKTILDAANAVIANNTTRKPKAAVDRAGRGGEPVTPLPRRGRVRRGGLGGRRDRPPARTAKGSADGDVAVFYRTNAQSRALEEALVRSAIAYKVVGGHPLLRPARGQGPPRLPAGRSPTRPTRSRPRASSTCPAAAWATPRSTAWPPGPATRGCSFADALGQAAEEAGVTGQGRWPGSASLSHPARRAARRWPTPAPARARSLEAVADRTGYRAELEAEDTVEAAGRLENIAELVGGGHRATTTSTRSSRPWPWSPTPTRSSGDGSRVVAHDPAHGQGPRVPGRVPHRHGGRGLPPPAFPRRPHAARGGAPAGLRRHHPGPARGSTSPTPGAGPSGASTSHAIPSRFLSEIPAELVRDVGASTTLRPDPTRVVSSRLRRRPRDPGGSAFTDPASTDPDTDTWSDAAREGPRRRQLARPRSLGRRRRPARGRW